jgi:hypothetical protein
MKNNAMAIGVRTQIIYGALAIMAIILSMGENTMAQTKSTTVVRNIVLVHGGFVDGSGWEGVYNVLRKDGYTITLVQNPTISLADDVAVTSVATSVPAINTSYKPSFGYLSDLGECLGDHALTEIRRFQIAEKPPSTDNSTPFTKLESSEARNRAAAAISSGRPIFPLGIRDSNIRFASSVRTWSCIGVAIGPGLSTFTRIFLPFSSLSQVRANERKAALLAEYTP